ncbi:MAG: type IV secretory system conjugative DNA transfer family protein [Thaumarchaeota archaeon]|nr:type IV secretory system conjugative DNA transfer family protein [Nitrososphaerota archaeon]
MLSSNVMENFNSKIFDCLDEALLVLGKNEKEHVLFALENEYHITAKNIGSNPKLEEALKETLGHSGSAFVIMHTLENIVSSFKISRAYGDNLARAIGAAKKSAI